MRFGSFSNKELDAMETAFCNERLDGFVDEIRIERRYREWLEKRAYEQTFDAGGLKSITEAASEINDISSSVDPDEYKDIVQQ
jgi:hypothetical protein